MLEEWKESKFGYKVSNLGQVMGKRGKLLCLRGCNNGYLNVGVYFDKKQRCMYVHRLIYETFNGSVPNGYELDHVDGNRTNNSIDNLEVVTRRENVNRAYKRNGVKKNLPTGVFVSGDGKKRKKPYFSTISINGKPKYLGSFETIKEAETAYLKNIN